jgi:hypothetical protein
MIYSFSSTVQAVMLRSRPLDCVAGVVPVLPEGRQCLHTERNREAFLRSGSSGRVSIWPKFVAAPKKANALTDKPARELAGGISGTQQQGDGRLAPDTGAVEIEACPYGSGSPNKGWPKGERSPLGLSYGEIR